MFEGKVSLTREEARERSSLVSACRYQVELDLAQGDDRFGFSVRLEFRGRPGATTFVDADLDLVDEIRWLGQPLDREAFSGQRLRLPPLQEINLLEVRGSSPYHRTGLGLHLAVDPADQERYLYTDLEPAEAHRVFPCFDQPDIKGTFQFRVRVPAEWTVVSVEPGQPAAADPDGTTWWTFPPTAELSPYVLGVAAGHFHSVHAVHGSIPLGLFGPQSLAEDLDQAAPEIFEISGQGLDFYQQLFQIPYPYSKYDQIACLEKVNGAMESPACVTFSDRVIYRGKPSFRERSLRAEVILHEMAHMWFGDLVTLRWWDDLWFNESFATLAAALAMDRATRFEDAWTYWTTAFKQLAVEEDQRSTSHPVVTAVPDVESVHLNFDGITYQKGAAVLRQLAAWTGEEAFFGAVHDLLQSHREGNAEFQDLVRNLSRTSGRDVAAWARSWLETVGINTLRCDLDGSPDTPAAPVRTMRVLQSASPAQPVLRSHRLRLGLYDWKGSALEPVRELELDVEGQVTQVAGLEGSARPPLLLPNQGALSYVKVRLDPVSRLTAEEHLSSVSDPMGRAILWDWAWDRVLDAELAASRYVQIVMAHLPRESDPSLVPLGMRNARTALARFVARERSELLETELAAVAAATLERTEPGSPAQLAWLRAFISAATSSEQVGRCRAMLGGAQLPAGVGLDIELRWALVSSATQRGAAGEDDIEACLRLDPTTGGHVRAMAARAAVPSAEAKEAVFRHLTEDPRATTEEAIWVGRSFGGIRQDQLLLPFIPRFLSAAGRLLTTQGPEYTRHLAQSLTASLPPSQELAAGLQEQLGLPGLDPDLRRIYQDCLEDTERARRARRLDQESPLEPFPTSS